MNTKQPIKKSIQLTSKPLETILSDGQSLDFRLDQDAWRDIRPGDYLEFWEDFSGWDQQPSDRSRKVIVRVQHIFKAASFQQLFERIEYAFSRLQNTSQLLQNLRSWWTKDKEVSTGVLAFHVVAVDCGKIGSQPLPGRC